MMSVMGILVMTVNWMIGLLHIFVSSKVGFARRDREGLLIFKAFSTLCFVSFLFNVAITIFPESSAHPLRFLLHPLGEGRPVTSMQDISFQVRASVHLFHVLVPGSLFIGYLLFPLQGFVWPAVSTISFLRFWHSRSFTPDLKAREAEKAMEPLGMSLGHDYMGFVVQPLSCSLTLFFASGVAWQTFAFLAAWSAFMMPFTRQGLGLGSGGGGTCICERCGGATFPPTALIWMHFLPGAFLIPRSWQPVRFGQPESTIGPCWSSPQRGWELWPCTMCCSPS